MTHYQVLGVPPGAAAADIRAAYVRLARRHHPDAGGTDARMQELNEAWSVLGDRRRRRDYDVSLGIAGSAGATPAPPEPDVDVDLADDRPLHGGRQTPPLLTVAPVGLFVASIVVGVLGMMLAVGALLGLAIVLFGCSVALMVVLPLLEMTRGRRR